MDVDELKNYLRIDDDNDDEEIEAMKEAAKQYIKNAGVEVEDSNKLANICTKILVSHWYENRGAVSVGQTTDSLDYTLDNIITQMKYAGDSS